MIGIEDCLSEAMSIPGALDAILVDHTSGMAVAGEGVQDPARSALGLTEAFRATLDGIALSSADGTAARIEDVIITTDTSYHLIRPMEMMFDGPLLICLRLDLEHSNLALARRRLRTITHQLIAH
ncbi:roadblock/LC7 domain-containing protein [Planotetraspora sp. A-T 1434]|uniref:roadblock/LC7 domain-containing protein n=1 Tax=Planotetraspora sp. A-T 1434 TaxID=2979219 RepID=UPI0021C1FB93|nr:roadblock/LC7 domain-containing protein [Planotetraspora sp. A-T 1434]MCT9930917.1 roadblock/LC7 domain-containing protein [Planotetraspora sp. A-T 1434]